MSQMAIANSWVYGYLAVSAVTPLVGLNLLLRPRSFCGMLQSPEPRDAQARKMMHASALLFAARELTVGSILWGMWFLGQQKAMGWAMLSCVPMALLDGYALQTQIGHGYYWTNYLMLPVVGAIGAKFSGWI